MHTVAQLRESGSSPSAVTTVCGTRLLNTGYWTVHVGYTSGEAKPRSALPLARLASATTGAGKTVQFDC